MKHIKKLEAFVIPRPVRKFHPWWKDEEIALNVLDELKKIERRKTKYKVNDLEIKPDIENKYTFKLDEFPIEVSYWHVMGPGGLRYDGKMTLDGLQLEVSDEVCKKICNVLKKLLSIDDELLKKDFKVRRGMI